MHGNGARLVQAARVARALGHPVRLEILRTLGTEGAYVMHLVAALGRPQANVSQHLAILREAGLVVDEREGTRVLYRLRDPQILEAVELLLELAARTPLPSPVPHPRWGRPGGGRGGRCGCPRCRGG